MPKEVTSLAASVIVVACLSIGLLIGIVLATRLNDFEGQLASTSLELQNTNANLAATKTSLAKHQEDRFKRETLLDEATVKIELLQQRDDRITEQARVVIASSRELQSNNEKLAEQVEQMKQTNRKLTADVQAQQPNSPLKERLPPRPKRGIVPPRRVPPIARVSGQYTSEVDDVLPTLKLRVTQRAEDADGYTTVAWKLDLENLGNDTIDPWVEIRWVDKDGFVLNYCHGADGKDIAPGETKHFAGDILLEAREARRVHEVTMDITI